MLTGKQKRFLRSKAHNVDPVLQIGKSGISDNMVTQIKDTLENRVLIKIHVLQNNSEDKNDLAQSLSDATRSDIVQVIGSMIVLYKESQDNKHIQLP
ncbi:ribosome assembly RNA-binding protein YhbY [Staphylococcus succinus]|uniref:Ribosome assembly RNA-binding protein YhbY n=1 Tax=Staphylococcus succinus TaxID=61015 RepID=A0ABX5ISC6_9STAP|nr:ribosome assembly RNA-binding protein YhbY [Staphylococcus succinus]PTI70603.1 ribosome assembly RNA-binding protein YhbY [Staphylococcus succinus]